MKTLASLDFWPTKEGRIPDHISIAIRDAVRGAGNVRMTFKVSVAKKFVSDPQRAYYFAVIVPCIQGLLLTHGGQFLETDEIHDFLMWDVGQWVKNRKGPHGEIIRVRRSYANLSTMEAEEHHMKCRAWAAERGLDIPEPNEEEHHA